MHPSRRAVLAAGTLGLAVACTESPPRVVSADERRMQDAAVREEALIQLYDATLAAFPALAPVLTPLREDHVQHRKALGASVTPTGTAAPALVAKTPAEARRRLAALESATAGAHADTALVCARGLAPLFASLAACETAHLVVL